MHARAAAAMRRAAAAMRRTDIRQPGGLVLTVEDSSTGGARAFWKGVPDGSNILSDGESVVGWSPVTDPTIPRGAYSAAASHLPGGTARHLYVASRRAVRTRMNTARCCRVVYTSTGRSSRIQQNQR